MSTAVIVAALVSRWTVQLSVHSEYRQLQYTDHATAATREKYIRVLILDWTWKKTLRHFAQSFHEFSGAKYSTIFDTTRYYALWFLNVATHRKSKTSAWSANDWSSFWLRHFAHHPLIFTEGGSKCDIVLSNLAFEALQFWNEAACLKPETDVGSCNDWVLAIDQSLLL